MVGSNDVLSLASRKLRLFFSDLESACPQLRHPNGSVKAFRRSHNERGLKARLLLRFAHCLQLVRISLTRDPFQKQLNIGIEKYSGIVREVAKENGSAYIPVREAILAQMVNSPRRVFSRFRLLSFNRDSFRVLILRKTLDEVAQSNWLVFSHRRSSPKQPGRDDRCRSGFRRFSDSYAVRSYDDQSARRMPS